MADPTNDIDALLILLAKFGWERYHATAKALVAERDALRKECNNRFVKIKELVAEEESLRAELAAAKKQRDEARELNKEWQQKAATWLATPEAVARLQSYRDLGQQAAKAQNESDALRAELAAAKAELVSKADELAAMRKQRDEARRWLRDACAEIARIETRFYDALTPQQIAERNGWDCFAKEGGGA